MLIAQAIISPVKIEHQRFNDLLRRLLQWDPDSRMTVREALDHSFFDLHLSDEGNTPQSEQ